MAAAHDLRGWEKDTRLFLFTSLTAGSSHIITATSRMETILKANRVPFQAIDLATDEQARRLWGRRAGKKKLPGLVKEGFVIGDLEEVEDWNEFGELKENIGPVSAAAAGGPTGFQTAAQTVAPATVPNPLITKVYDTKDVQASLQNLSMKEAAAQAASIGAARKGPVPGVEHTKTATSSLAEADEATKPETMNSSSAAKAESVRAAKDNATLAADAQPVKTPAAQQDDKDTPTPNAQVATAMTETGQAKEASLTLSGDKLTSETAVQDEELDTPASEIQASNLSTTASTQPEDAVGGLVPAAGATQQKHRGSSVSNVSVDEIKEIEQSSAIPEVEDEDDDTTEAQPKTQAQESAAADKASVSVQD